MNILVNQPYKYEKVKKNIYKASYLLALSNAKQGKIKQAYQLLDSLQSIQQIYLHNDKYSSEIFRIISRIYESLNDFKNAYLFRKKSAEINDSIQVVTILSNSDNITREYLHLNNKISEERLQKNIQKNKFLFILFLIISLTLIFIVTILYVRSNENKKHLKHERYLSNELKKINEELKRTNSMLYQSELYNKFLLKYLAHDLRNPLSSIKGLVDIIRLEDDNKDLDTYLNLIESQASTSLEFITYLLHSSSTSLHKKNNSLNEVIESSIQTTSQSARKKNVFIANKVNEPIFCYFDYYKIWSLLNNLISNAIKFSPRDSSVVINATKSDSHVSISIKDNGIGMPQSLIDKILNDDLIEGRQGTEGEESFGIGLKICKQIVDLHNGKLRIQSEEGKGSTFIIELPCEDKDILEKSDNSMETLETS
ncbi:MAG: sensor histidine kinase [Thermaurantimonas sp.]|uniref:sensor histidine kinase n=1 Tax=Thermaurantimonas sp. TaxID=2681568 RepID=UPI003918EC10